MSNASHRPKPKRTQSSPHLDTQLPRSQQVEPSDPLHRNPSQSAATPSQQPQVIPTAPPTSHTQTVMATFPLVSHPTRNTPLHGSLNRRDEFFFIQASVQMLEAIINSAPSGIRSSLPANASRDRLLAEVLKLHQQGALSSQASPASPPEILNKLMIMDTQDVVTLAFTNPFQLKSWMKLASQIDPSIQTNSIELDSMSKDDLVFTVLDWQLKAHKAVSASFPKANTTPPVASAPPRISIQTLPGGHGGQQFSMAQAVQAPASSSLPTLAGLLGPQATNPQNQEHIGVPRNIPDTSDEEEITRPSKKAKFHIEPQGFTYGSTATIEEVLKNYPGKASSSNSLNIPDMKGPTILAHIIGAGSNIPTFLSQFKHWRKTATGNPSQPKVEAHTFGRMIHTELLKHETPLEALANRPSLEIDLRRLYAVLFVEEAVNTGTVKDRAAAWKHIQFILESQPQGTVMNDPITEEMTRLLNLEKKRLTAVKAMEEVTMRRGKNGQQDNNSPNNPPQGQRRQGNRQ